MDTTILAAAISAWVAVLLFFVSQWILSHKAQVEHLTTKLEELYLAVNNLQTSHTARYEKVRFIANGDTSYLDDHEAVNKLILCELTKHIDMYVHLYFPLLQTSCKEMFYANDNVNALVHRVISGETVDQEEFSERVIKFNNKITAFEKEIRENKKGLVKDFLFHFRYYRYSTKDIV